MTDWRPGDHILVTWHDWGHPDEGPRLSLDRAPARILQTEPRLAIRLDPVTPTTTQLPLYPPTGHRLRIEPADDQLTLF